jgi:hypothetical protein
LQSFSEYELTQFQYNTLNGRFGVSVTHKKLSKAQSKNKKEKKSKIPTHLMTLELLERNLLIEEIATERQLTVGTILQHIERLKSLKEIEISHILYLKNSLPKQDFDILYNELNLSENGAMGPIYHKFAGKYSYAHIQLVRLFIE